MEYPAHINEDLKIFGLLSYYTSETEECYTEDGITQTNLLKKSRNNFSLRSHIDNAFHQQRPVLTVRRVSPLL